MEYITEFPSEQAEALQKHMKELDEKGKLKEEFLKKYQNNMGKANSLANYIDKNWETRCKKLYMEYTGIEVYKEAKEEVMYDSIKLDRVSYGSRRHFLWKCCDCGNEWTAQINDRTRPDNRKVNCPECANKHKINKLRQKGESLGHWCDRQNTYGEQIRKEFMGRLEDDTPINIDNISKGSGQKVWWKCSKCQYEWKTTVVHRTCKQRQGCPACGKYQFIPGINDLETYCQKQHPELKYILEEFIGLDSNGNRIKASEISRASIKKVQWRCNKCHKIWLAEPHSRTGNGKTGCPYCATNTWTSFPEQYLFNSLKQLFPRAMNRAKTKDTHYEYDIVIPELNLCIEYSGYNWHQDKLGRDEIKKAYCKSKDINFLQIYAHQGNMIEVDTYTKEKIIYQVINNKSQHILQLQQIIGLILKEYSSEALYSSINFKIAEQQANEIMGKA